VDDIGKSSAKTENVYKPEDRFIELDVVNPVGMNCPVKGPRECARYETYLPHRTAVPQDRQNRTPL
jgi:hypothetical protein